MKFTTIVSGSSGNCLYVGGREGGVLIDGGCSLRAVRQALAQLGIAEDSLRAMFITHEHSDHISGAARICRGLHLPLYATEQTWEKMPFREDFSPEQRHTFHYGMEIGGMSVEFLKLSHDAVQPVSFVFSEGNQRVGVATDTGTITPTMAHFLQGVDGLILEANHDRAMLLSGPYPRYLKDRVLGEKGHLSNAQAGAALAAWAGPNTRSVILAHLSTTNNLPNLALDTVCAALVACPEAEHMDVTVAPRYCPHSLVDLEQQ